MTSDRQARANQRNASRSTGPRSKAGKARSARNARKYGFTGPPEEGSGGPEALRSAAQELLGDLVLTDERLGLAQTIIAADISLKRAKKEKETFLREAMSDWETYRVPGHYTDLSHPLVDLLPSRPGRAPLFRRVWVMPSYEMPSTEDEKMALVLSKKAKELRRYDRYIAKFTAARRRALSALYRSTDG